MKSAVVILSVLALVILGSVTVSASDPLDPEPSFVWESAAPPICGLYPGWQPGDEFGPGDVVECPPDEFPIGPNPSGLEPEVLAPVPATPRPTPIVVGEPSPSTETVPGSDSSDLGSEIPAVWSIDLPATDAER